jgi:hypothetical protein
MIRPMRSNTEDLIVARRLSRLRRRGAGAEAVTRPLLVPV